MRNAAIVADRRQAVRDEAREWLRSGWIDQGAFEKIEQLYPDDRVRTGPAFRILFFVLTLAAIVAFLGALYSQIGRTQTIAAVAFIVGGICFGAAEYLVNEFRRREGGIEAAVTVAALANLIVGVTILLIESWGLSNHYAPIVLFLIVGLLLCAAAWIWGYWVYAALSSAMIFFSISSMSCGRLLYLVVAVAACVFLFPLHNSMRLAPSLRKSVLAFLAVTVAAAYAGSNVFLLDQHFLGRFPIYSSEYFPRPLSIVLTGLLPCIVLAIGFVRRQRLFMVIGFGLGLLSLATLRAYVHVAPAWIVLVSSGVALMIFAGVLRRFLDSSSNHERNGFTAQPLTDPPGKYRGAEIITTLGTMTPRGSSLSEPSGFEGGDGGFGGGGASGKF